MDFPTSIRTCFTKYADFKGCASLPEFWWFMLFTFVGQLALGVVSSLVAWAFVIAVFLPGVAVTSRRLHDTNRSGWLQLLLLVPLIGWIVVLVFCAQQPKRPSIFCE